MLHTGNDDLDVPLATSAELDISGTFISGTSTLARLSKYIKINGCAFVSLKLVNDWTDLANFNFGIYIRVGRSFKRPGNIKKLAVTLDSVRVEFQLYTYRHILEISHIYFI